MAGNRRNESDISKSRTSHAFTASGIIGGGGGASDNVANTTGMNKSQDSPSKTIMTNGTKVICKMIRVDPDKLKQFGLDMKIKKAVAQSIESPVNKVCSPVNRTIKLVQKVKLTPALSSKRAEKIPETSFNLNLLQRQISDKLKINRSTPSPTTNQSIKPAQPIKLSTIINNPNSGMSSTPNIKTVTIKPKVSPVQDTADNNFKGWSDEKNTPIGVVRNNNTSPGSPISHTTAKRLSDVIKSKTCSTTKQDQHVKTFDVIPEQNGTNLETKTSEQTSHRLAPQQIEVSKVVKTPGTVKTVLTIQSAIVDRTEPPAITFDINSIATCSRELKDAESRTSRPVSAKSHGSSKEFSKIPAKFQRTNTGEKKTQKLWSKFNKFKKRNKKLQMENQELKNRLYTLMENMSSMNSPKPQINLSQEAIATPSRLQSAEAHPTSPIVKTPNCSSQIKQTTLTEKTVPILENVPTPLEEVQTEKPPPLAVIPIQEIKTDRLRGKKLIPNLFPNNHRIKKYNSQEPAVGSSESIEMDVNKNNLVGYETVISERIEYPHLVVPVIKIDHDKEILVPEIAEELEICDVDEKFPEQSDEVELFPKSTSTPNLDDGLDFKDETSDEIELFPKSTSSPNLDGGLDFKDDVQGDVDLDMNISIDSLREHDYSLREDTETEIGDTQSNDSCVLVEPNIEMTPKKLKSMILILENRILFPDSPEIPICSNLELAESIDHDIQNNVSLNSVGPTTSIVINDSNSPKKLSSKNQIILEETAQETPLIVDTEDFDECFIEPPAYSPITSVDTSTNPLKETRSNEVDTMIIPVIQIENVPVKKDEIQISEKTKVLNSEPFLNDEAPKNQDKVLESTVPQQNSTNELINSKLQKPIRSRRSSFDVIPELVKPVRTYSSNKKPKLSNFDTIEVLVKTEEAELPITEVKQDANPDTHDTSVTKRRRSRKPKIAQPVIIETPVPQLSKNRRRSRKSISPIINCDNVTTPIATIETPAVKRSLKPRKQAISRKRIKFEESTVVHSDDGDDFLGFPDNTAMPVPMQELLIEIKTEPGIEPELDVIVEKPKTPRSAANVTCGNCKENMLAKNWNAHLKKHNGLGFREGLDDPIDLTDFRDTLNVMIYYMKTHKLPFVACEKCGTTRKSALGLMSHIQICGLPVEEQRIPCVHCGNRLLPVSLPYHMQNSCMVLKRNQTIEIIKKTDPEPDHEVVDGEMEVTQSGRAKRKSVMAAEKKIKNFIDLIDDINVDNHFSEKRLPIISGGTKRGWACQLQNTGSIKCRITTCDYTTDSVKQMSVHASSCRNIDEVFGFYCRHCKFYSATRDPMVEHISKEHANFLSSINNLEYHSGSEASAGEESSESDGSSGEDEIECDDGSEVEDHDGDMLDEDGNERSRMRSSAGCSSGGGSEYKTTDTADALLRDYSVLIKHQMSSVYYYSILMKQPQLSFYHFAYKWTVEFIEKYFSNDPLYLNLMPSAARYISESDAKDYIPIAKTSPKFSFRMENDYEGEFGKLAKKVNPNDWDHLQLFTGKYKEKHNSVLYCGGPVLCLDWATFPVSYKDDQYLAVSCYRDYNDSTRSNELHAKKGVIQIWNLGDLIGKQEPTMKFAFKVDFGPVCDIKFCPSGGYIPGERIGLLAVTSMVGDVYIYALPYNIDEQQDTNIIELQPSLTLRPCINTTTKCRQAYRLSWTKDKAHSIIATGYTDGWVAIWNIQTESKLLKKIINGRPVIMPSKIFHPFSGTIRGIELFYINNSQWLMVAADKNVKLFDLKTYPYPHEVSNVYQKSTITCSAWWIHWPGYLLGLNESFCLLRNSVTLTQPHEIGYKNYPIQSYDATVTDIAVSDYLNAYTGATDSGDIISYLPRDLLLNISRKGNRRLKLISGYTDAIVLDEEMADIRSKFGVVFCDLAHPILSSHIDLKSKSHRRWTLEQYPIVTITRVQFNPNQNVHDYYALGMQSGFVRIRCMVPKSDC